MNPSEAEDLLMELASVFFPDNQASRTTSQIEEGRPDITAHYRILVEQIPAVVFLAFLDKGVGEACVSPQIEAVLGFTQEEWLNDPVRWYRQIHPDDKQRWSHRGRTDISDWREHYVPSFASSRATATPSGFAAKCAWFAVQMAAHGSSMV